MNYKSFLVGLSIFSLNQVHATQTFELHAERDINVQSFFNSSIVGSASTEFVDPIAQCEMRFRHSVSTRGRINCHQMKMGSERSDFYGGFREYQRYDETQHLVEISQNFEIQKTEVTQLQWLTVMQGTDKLNPSDFSTDCGSGNYGRYNVVNHNGEVESIVICKNSPVENVSYNDIVGDGGFLERLNASQDDYTYSLPTEAQWEFSARGGNLRVNSYGVVYPRYSFGDEHTRLENYAYFRWNSLGGPNPVGTLRPNQYGIYDMHGNVWEITADYYERNYGLSDQELQGITMDPVGPEDGRVRVIRGGGFSDIPPLLRTAVRSTISEDTRSRYTGFRLVRVPR